MAESGPPTQTDKGWGIDWRSHGTWGRLAFGTIKLFIIVTSVPLLVGVILTYTIPNARDDLIALYIPILSVLIIPFLINRASTDRGVGQTGLVSAGERILVYSGSMRDRIFFYSWLLVFVGLGWLSHRWAYGYFYPDHMYMTTVSWALLFGALAPLSRILALVFGRPPIGPAKAT